MLSNARTNAGMQSTQVDEACDDYTLEQFSSKSYTSHTSSKVTELSLLPLKPACDHRYCSENCTNSDRAAGCWTISSLFKGTMTSQKEYIKVIYITILPDRNSN